MNAAAKMIHQSNIFSGQFTDIRFSKSLCLHLIVLFSLLVSAVAVVCSTNDCREAYSQLQFEEQRSHELELRWGQLLLEQASLSTPARVQRLARDKMHMLLPANQNIYMLRLK